MAVKVAADLKQATNLTTNLHGSDILITQQLITKLINYEVTMTGLNLTHSQDKDYILVGVQCVFNNFYCKVSMFSL